MSTSAAPAVPVERVKAVVESMQAGHHSVWFEDVIELLDGLMLSGAHAEPGATEVQATARIVVARGDARRPALTWVVLLLAAHDIEMRCVSGPRTVGRLNYASAFDWRYVPAVRRWSHNGRATTPTDLVLTERTAAMWLVSGLTAPGKVSALKIPGNNATTLRRLGRQLQRIAPIGRLSVSASAAGSPRIVLGDDALPAMEQWLGERVPPAVWRE